MKKVNKGYKVVSFRALTGEHHSLLVDEAGFPDWWSTRWAIEKLREKGQASTTITSKLRAVQLLYTAIPKASELTDRLAAGHWLTPSEADHLLEQMAYPAPKITAIQTSSNLGNDIEIQKQTERKKIVSLESVRSKLKTTAKQTVGTETKKLRMLFIREYLSWRAKQHMLQMRGARKIQIADEINELDEYLKQRTNSSNGKNSIQDIDKGLSDEQFQVLKEAIEPSSKRNVWINRKFLRLRNQLIIELMLNCGTRRGAILGINMQDIDEKRGRIRILRRPDDPADPREIQTGDKRTEYLITMGYKLLSLLKDYSIQRHKVIARTKSKTQYLIVSESGQPIEQSTINYTVNLLRDIEELVDIHPHFLRHVWACNYVASRVKENCDINMIEDELRTLGGWSKGSDMPARYTQYYRDKSSSEASLRLQAKTVPMKAKAPKK